MRNIKDYILEGFYETNNRELRLYTDIIEYIKRVCKKGVDWSDSGELIELLDKVRKRGDLVLTYDFKTLHAAIKLYKPMYSNKYEWIYDNGYCSTCYTYTGEIARLICSDMKEDAKKIQKSVNFAINKA